MNKRINIGEQKDAFEKQLSVFDSFVKTVVEESEKFGFSDETTKLVLEELHKAKKGYEKGIQEIERIRQEELERQRQEEQARLCRITSMEIPMDWENPFLSDQRAERIQAESAGDGLILSLTNLGRVDIEYISLITGLEMPHVISALRGAIYQNPVTWEECFYKGWETAEEYLSGNLRRKWKTAMSADEKYHGYFKENIAALEQAMPEPLRYKDIYVTLGSPWVPTDVIDEFIEHLFGKNKHCNPEYYKTKHDEITGSWEIPNKLRYGSSVAVTVEYGTARINALHILERTLNMKTIAVCDTVPCASNSNGTRREINNSDTLLAQEKQNKLIAAFQNWVWRDKKRRERLERIYEERYSCVRKRRFGGSFLNFPGMDNSVQLYPYQKNAVARILFSPNTLLAHDVGAGKTYIMIAAAMELKRMKLSRKNLFVVPNNLIGQWRDTFMKMYPNANILCVTPPAFVPAKRRAVLESIRDADFDGIIMAYSCFEQISVSQEYVLREYESAKRAAEAQFTKNDKATQALQRKCDKLREKISELTIHLALSDEIFFDELGIDRLFVDEAHHYKNVPLETKISNVLGVSSAGSAKCRDMLDKTRIVQNRNGGGGVVFATGTPVTNSITDIYVMQKYLQSGELAMLDLQSFDSWVGMFAERVTEFEVEVIFRTPCWIMPRSKLWQLVIRV